MIKAIKVLWKNIRRLSGDDAYEQYLQHYSQYHSQQHHAEPQVENTDVEDAEPLSREVFFKQWQDKKWKGVKRCC
ncbi:hypothetical protein GALL_293140 [mine drainage metagenome]|uniref:YbdD/YjiX family protein n=1 Tax=mine drainage metagenome TaxID=410659 RepID=A0A1J5QYL1_9ZZZZ